MAEAVADVVGSAVESMDSPLMESGLDSLGAVELRNGLAGRFGVEVDPLSCNQAILHRIVLSKLCIAQSAAHSFQRHILQKILVTRGLQLPNHYGQPISQL